MMKHRRVRRSSAPEDGILSRRDASGSAEAKNDEGEVPRSLSKVVAKGRRTSRNRRFRGPFEATLSKVMTRTFGCGGRLKSGER